MRALTHSTLSLLVALPTAASAASPLTCSFGGEAYVLTEGKGKLALQVGDTIHPATVYLPSDGARVGAVYAMAGPGPVMIAIDLGARQDGGYPATLTAATPTGKGLETRVAEGTCQEAVN